MTEPKAAAVVYAKDAGRVAAFYAAVMGATVTRTGDRAVVESPTLQLTVVTIPASIARDIEIAEPPVRRTETAVKLVFPVDRIAHVREAVRPLGGVVDPTDAEWRFEGALFCNGQDPEGNVIQVRQPLG